MVAALGGPVGGTRPGPVVPGSQLQVKFEHWTIPEAVELLAQAHWVDLGWQGLGPDPVTLEALAWALDGNPQFLEKVWDAWEAELILSEWSPECRNQARYWFDTVVIGRIATT